MRNELLGYLVGALEKDEQAQVASKLHSDNQLQSEMEILRRGLVPLEADGERFEPPADLWRRAVEYVDASCGDFMVKLRDTSRPPPTRLCGRVPPGPTVRRDAQMAIRRRFGRGRNSCGGDVGRRAGGDPEP